MGDTLEFSRGAHAKLGSRDRLVCFWDEYDYRRVHPFRTRQADHGTFLEETFLGLVGRSLAAFTRACRDCRAIDTMIDRGSRL